ncbi:hypothetical protein BC628DRAFT_1395122 [Trametes gibbosa]|nr:hypothetical protein BC628DRAFT_1395122 [Trametes gibbosa]
MADVDSSDRPAPGPVTKVTYAGRQKRQRESVASYKDPTDSEDEPQDQDPQSSPVKRTASEKMSTKNPSPKKVEVHLPGPSPKRPRHDAPELGSAKKPVSKARKATHSRAGSAISNFREDTMDAGRVSPSKPVSDIGMKPPSMVAVQRTETPEDGADDRSSIGESSKLRVRKTEAERRQFLEEDPHSGDVEAHRVFCKACDTWIELNLRRRYIMRLWLEHRKQCKSATTESPSKVKVEQEGKAAEDAIEDDDASVAATSVTEGHRRVVKEEDRKALLEADPRVTEVKPDMVFCKDCQKWVKLSPSTRYSLYHWRKHSQKCTSNVPSSRVATAQRKLKLVNDPHMESFTARSVDCKLCRATVELGGSSDYDLTNWEEHKSVVHSVGPSTSPAVSAEVVPKPIEDTSAGSPRPPPSSASTDETVVATDSSPPRKGTKRAREDDDIPERAVRQRDDAYIAPEGDAPGFLGWIVAPVKNFIRGFREGLAG